MIHYSEFAARRASPGPLLGAIASLAAIALCLGDPQAGVGTAPAAHIPALAGPAVSVPERRNDEISLRAHNPSGPPASDNLSSGPTAQPAAVAPFNRDRAPAGPPLLPQPPAPYATPSPRARTRATAGLP